MPPTTGVMRGSKLAPMLHAPMPVASRPSALSRRPQLFSASAAAAPTTAPQQATQHQRVASVDAPQHPSSSVVALLTATGADSISPMPLQQQPLYQTERFEDVYTLGEVLGNGTYGASRRMVLLLFVGARMCLLAAPPAGTENSGASARWRVATADSSKQQQELSGGWRLCPVMQCIRLQEQPCRDPFPKPTQHRAPLQPQASSARARTLRPAISLLSRSCSGAGIKWTAQPSSKTR